MSYADCVSLKPYGSIAEAAEMVGIPEKLVRERVTSGSLRYVRQKILCGRSQSAGNSQGRG